MNDYNDYDGYDEDLIIYEEALRNLNIALSKATKKNIEYLKIFEVYYKRIIECDDILDAKKWAHRMIDHTLEVGNKGMEL